MSAAGHPTLKDVPLVRLQNITLRVAEGDLFANTCWTIRRGEQWAVVGANGSGKSTLLGALYGNTPTCAGVIEYGMNGPRAILSEGLYPEGAIAMVSVEQHRALVASAMDYHQARWSPIEDRESLSVRDIVFEGAVRSARRKWRGVAGLLDLDISLSRSITSLSNGEMRKVLLARALITSPQLLILDNPFAGLDTHSRRRLRLILRTLMKGGLPIVVATARLDEIPAATTHVLYVEQGRVLVQGRKRAVLRHPRVKAILGTPPETAPPPRLCWRRTVRSAGVPGRPMIEIRRANVAYDKVAVLQNVSWTVRAGENWVLRGPNGSGKSTLISLILGDNPQAYANDIRLFGIQRGSGESIWEIKERIGWLSPELQFHYYGDVTCYEVVCSGLYDTIGLYRDCSLREARAVRHWMRILGVFSWAHTPFGALSDGQQRLVLLARALVKEPPLLIFDEPCQGLDAVHRRRVLAILDQIAAQPQTTVIYVTHHADEISPSFHHELYLCRGRVIRRGPR